jgi:hypothetical protein
MMANILLINMFILVNDYGPYVISALICTSMLVIVRHQRASLFSLFWGMQKTEPKESSRTHWWIRIMIVAAVSTIMISGALMQHSLRR